MLCLALDIETIAKYVYLIAAVLFIYGLKMLSSVSTARKGNLISALGMLLAATGTLFRIGDGQMVILIWIVAALVLGAGIGLLLALKTQMTAMPQMVALLNGFGGIASLLVACADYISKTEASGRQEYKLLATGLTVLIGGLTFTGSLVAFGKLQGLRITPGRPIQFPGQKVIIGLAAVACLGLSVYPL